MSVMSIDHHNQTHPPRQVTVIGFDDALLLDIAGPAQVFGSANKVLGHAAYDISIASRDAGPVQTDTGLVFNASANLDAPRAINDLIIPGGPGVDAFCEDAAFLDKLRHFASQADRVIAICSGSLLLAATGLLDGKCATSHWERSEQLAIRFPKVLWQLDQIYTEDGAYHCSAGVTAGIDLSLALLEQDHGRETALDVAREMVVFMRRFGGQSQFSKPLVAQLQGKTRLSKLYAEITQNPADDWRITVMADHAGMTERSLHRHFIKDLALSPSQFVAQQRLALARSLLERTQSPIQMIASQSGFRDVQTLRRAFQTHLGVTPLDYRSRFGSAANTSSAI